MFAYSIEMVGLIPWVISMVVASLLWRWLLNGDMGLLGFVSNWVGRPVYILEYKGSALIAMIFVMSWRTIGYAMVMLLAGLKSLDRDLLEAASIDGASKKQTLFRIKLPLIMTNFLLSLIVLTVSNFTNNTVPMALTNGGPAYATNVVTLEQYTLSFEYFDFGRASALALLIMLATAVIIGAYMKVTKYEL
jgi:ABC-type sugar transport system permease subunit